MVERGGGDEASPSVRPLRRKRPTVLTGGSDDILEVLNLLLYSPLRREPFHAGGAKRSVNALGVFHLVANVVRFRERTAVGDDEDVLIDRHRSVTQLLDTVGGVVQRCDVFRTDVAATGCSQVGDDQVRRAARLPVRVGPAGRIL